MTTTNTNLYIASLEKQLFLTTSAIRNLRNMMKRERDEGYGVPDKKRKWTKPMQAECDILRNRIDTLLGTMTMALSLRASKPAEMPLKITAESCKKALKSCSVEQEATITNLESALTIYDSTVNHFIHDICHGDEEVTWQRAAEYLEKSLSLSSLLVMD